LSHYYYVYRYHFTKTVPGNSWCSLTYVPGVFINFNCFVIRPKLFMKLAWKSLIWNRVNIIPNSIAFPPYVDYRGFYSAATRHPNTKSSRMVNPYHNFWIKNSLDSSWSFQKLSAPKIYQSILQHFPPFVCSNLGIMSAEA